MFFYCTSPILNLFQNKIRNIKFGILNIKVWNNSTRKMVELNLYLNIFNVLQYYVPSEIINCEMRGCIGTYLRLITN